MTDAQILRTVGAITFGSLGLFLFWIGFWDHKYAGLPCGILAVVFLAIAAAYAKDAFAL